MILDNVIRTKSMQQMWIEYFSQSSKPMDTASREAVASCPASMGCSSDSSDYEPSSGKTLSNAGSESDECEWDSDEAIVSTESAQHEPGFRPYHMVPRSV